MKDFDQWFVEDFNEEVLDDEFYEWAKYFSNTGNNRFRKNPVEINKFLFLCK